MPGFNPWRQGPLDRRIWCRPERPPPERPPPERSGQEQSLLLKKLSVDLLLEILDFLPPGSATALALTCASLRNTIPHKTKLHGAELDELLQLLERDLSNRFFFCQPCHILHRFSTSWTLEHQGHFDGPCRPEVEVRDTFQLGFHLARLAMNKHLLGGGLSLQQLAGSLPADQDDDGWHTSFTARVIRGELYLSVSHTLSLTGAAIENRYDLDKLEHGICNHVTTHMPPARVNIAMPDEVHAQQQWFLEGRFQAEPQRTRIPQLAPAGFPTYSHTLEEFEGAPGSCPVCLTDYSITTSRKICVNSNNETTGEEWGIVVVAYHQLGPCRSQSDWKWLTFATQLPDVCKEDLPASLLRMRRDGRPNAPGSVRARWDRS